MKRTPVLVMAGLLGASISLAACGSSNDSGSGSSGSSSAAKVGKVGVILPDTKSSTRWESADKPALTAAFKEAGVDADIQNAQGDKAQMQTIADSMITNGVSVLAIVNLDSESGAAIQKKAADQGVVTIDYDRLTLGGSAKYYVSFDNTKVGVLQGEGLEKCLGADTKANIAFLNGSPTDNNATLFAQGAHSVLDKNKNFTKVAEQAVPDWDNQQAATIFEQMYTAHKDINGVLAANDGLGNAVISILKKNNAAGKIPVTGQDATVQGLQNIMDGTQCMTVYKSAKEEAGALAKLAIALAKGETPSVEGTVTDTSNNTQRPAVLLDPVAVTKDNIKDVVSDGGVTKDELCTGDYAAKCTAAGVS